MEIYIIILLVLILFLLGYIILQLSLSKNSKDTTTQSITDLTTRLESKLQEQSDRNVVFERVLSQNLLIFKDNISNNFDNQFERLQNNLDKRILELDRKVNENLEEGFKKSKETFTNIVERLSKIDEAQKKIDALSTEIVSLQEVLTDKKARGAFGEVQLSHIMSSIFGVNNPNIYKLQYTFETGVRSDAVLFAPEPLGTIAIDSKFPLENYRKAITKGLDETTRLMYEKQFINDCRKHISDIADKYIITGVTSNQAILFLPAEAVFAYINAYHPELVEYANSKRVWMVSPTTLMSTLTTIQTILTNLEREKYASVIQENLSKLSEDFKRYKVRWDKLNRSLDTITQDAKNINITNEKITKRFDSIALVEDTKELEEESDS